MTKFKIAENEIARLRVFADYIKKLGTVYPLSDKQLFLLDSTSKKLVVFADGKAASGGNGVARVILDISDIVLNTQNNFITNIDTLLNLASKINGQINISFNDKQIILCEENGKDKFKSTLFITRSQDEIDELDQFIGNQLATPEFQNPIKIELKSNYDRFERFSKLTKILNVSSVIETLIDGSQIRFADNLCIMKYSDGQKTGAQEVFIEYNLIPMLKEVDELLISSDKKFIYFNIPNYGIDIIYAPKLPKWTYPTDQDIVDICPESSNQFDLEINAEIFYKTIDKFYGIFQPQYWKYNQIKIETKDITTTNELHLQFDDMANEVEAFLPVVVKQVGNENDFIWQLPTCYLDLLKSDFIKDQNSVLRLRYNGISESDPHGAGIIISNDNLTIVIAKVNE